MVHCDGETGQSWLARNKAQPKKGFGFVCLFVLSSKVLVTVWKVLISAICGRSVPYSEVTLEILLPRENVAW